jgi:hypothetical protein
MILKLDFKLINYYYFKVMMDSMSRELIKKDITCVETNEANNKFKLLILKK